MEFSLRVYVGKGSVHSYTKTSPYPKLELKVYNLISSNNFSFYCLPRKIYKINIHLNEKREINS